MNLVFAAAIAVMVGSAVYAMLRRELPGVYAGIVLLSLSTNLILLAAGILRGSAPVLPKDGGNGAFSDPLVQALALTAIVISFGLTALLLAIGGEAARRHDTLDQVELGPEHGEADRSEHP